MKPANDNEPSILSLSDFLPDLGLKALKKLAKEYFAKQGVRLSRERGDIKST